MKRALLLFLFILIALVTSVLTRLNLEPVTFNYYFGDIEISLAMLLLLLFIAGALTGLLLTIVLVLSSRRERRRMQRLLRLREQEIRNLRDIPIRGKH